MFPGFAIRNRICFFILVLALGLWLAGCRGLSTNSSTPNIPNQGQNPQTSSPVKHLIVIVMQNNSFDHLFGTFPGVNGLNPADPGFNQKDAAGNTVSPSLLTNFNPVDMTHNHAGYELSIDGGLMDGFARNGGDQAMGYYDNTVPGIDRLWGFAQQFALADNYFNSVTSSAPSDVLYMVSASDDGRIFAVQPAFGPCNKPDNQAIPYTFPNLAEELDNAGISWGWFHEQLGVCGNYVPQENPFQYFSDTHAAPNIIDYSNFAPKMEAGQLPSVSFIQPAGSHSMHPGAGPVSIGASWLDNLITNIQNSSDWPSTAIVVIWDEGGGWYDHVNPPTVDSQGFGVRVPMLVISPLAKKGYISHVQMDHVSILKFIQWNWKLPPLNARNQSPASGDLRDMFQF